MTAVGLFDGRIPPEDRVLRSLDEDAGLGAILRIGLSLPVAPFALEFLHWPLFASGR